jgi:hypothetical protein
MHQAHQSRPAASALQVLSRTERSLRLDAALRLAPGVAGWLQVRDGRVWLTRTGDPSDHVLRSGQAVHLGPGDAVVVEPWQAGRAAALVWTSGDQLPATAVPVGRAVQRAGVPPLRGWRVLLADLGARVRLVAGRLAARSAAPSA